MNHNKMVYGVNTFISVLSTLKLKYSVALLQFNNLYTRTMQSYTNKKLRTNITHHTTLLYVTTHKPSNIDTTHRTPHYN